MKTNQTQATPFKFNSMVDESFASAIQPKDSKIVFRSDVKDLKGKRASTSLFAKQSKGPQSVRIKPVFVNDKHQTPAETGSRNTNIL